VNGRSETGLTLIEVVIAIFISALIFAAIATAMVNNNKSSLENQRQVQLLSVLEQQVEDIHQVVSQNYSSVGFAALALSSNPAQGSDSSLPTSPTDPNDFITPYGASFVTATSSTSEGFLIENNYNDTTQGTIDGGTTYTEELEVDPTNGKIAPVTYVDLSSGTSYTSASNVPAGDPYAIVYVYITRATVGVNASLSACPSGPGPGSTADDARRVIVAAKLSPAASGRNDVEPALIQYSSTLIANPVPSNQCPSANGLRLGLNIQ